MKTPQELASNPLDSHTEHDRRAMALKRLAGGVRAAATGPYGLNQLEIEALLDAMLVLQDLASVNQKAGDLARKRRGS
ncbi:hypothetical protein [Rhodoferax sp.]|uniref:hypothetical protein n=1 Tax=Rhodoferax sp. TaxID=50421 RepID=UPI00276644C4|nr:hypothetical protein [Rhodoferax sp.]